MDTKTMFILILSIDLMLFLFNFAVLDINPEMNFYDYDGSIISQADSGDETYVIRQLDSSDLPGGTTSVDPESGGFFTDIFRSSRNWLFDNIPGAKTLVSIVNAVPNFLSAIGLPAVYTFAIGAFWHLFGIFALVGFLWGKE